MVTYYAQQEVWYTYCSDISENIRAKTKDRAAVHLECSRDHHEQVKEFLRIHCSKNTKPPYITGFLVIFIPDKMHISNKHFNSGAQIIAKRQGSLVNMIELRTSWSI